MSLTGRHAAKTFIYYLHVSLLHKNHGTLSLLILTLPRLCWAETYCNLGIAFIAKLCIKYIYAILPFLSETHDSCSLPNRQGSLSPPTSASLQSSWLSTTIPTPLPWPPSSRSRRSRGTASVQNTSGLFSMYQLSTVLGQT